MGLKTQTTATLGLSAVLIFGTTLVVIANLSPEFHFFEDYVSELGAQGQPYALWWNLIGFLLVGMLLSAFGYSYGRVLNDRVVGVCLSLFGVGFAFTALPIDLRNSESALSTAHVLAICLGLARMAQNKALGKSVRYSANIAAILVVLPMFVEGHEYSPPKSISIPHSGAISIPHFCEWPNAVR